MSASQTSKAAKPAQGRPPRRAQARAIGQVAGRILSPAFRRRGFAQTALIEQWAEIVGEELARYSLPEKISHPRGGEKDAPPAGRSRFSRGGEDGGGVLTLRVDGPLAVEIQHATPQLLERINGFFGYRAISRIALKQGPLPRRHERRAKKLHPLAPEEEQALDAKLQAIGDERLAHALKRLGRGVKGQMR